MRDHFDTYKHLDSPAEIGMSMDDIARQVVRSNYGLHRMVCALVKADEERRAEPSPLVAALRDAAAQHTF